MNEQLRIRECNQGDIISFIINSYRSEPFKIKKFSPVNLNRAVITSCTGREIVCHTTMNCVKLDIPDTEEWE